MDLARRGHVSVVFPGLKVRKSYVYVCSFSIEASVCSLVACLPPARPFVPASLALVLGRRPPVFTLAWIAG